MLATYAVGFGVLFNFIADLHLCELPSRGAALLFSPTLLGAMFVTYLVGSLAGAVDRPRRSRCSAAAASCSASSRVWIVGALLLLAPPVELIIAGLTLCAACGMLCQAVSTGYVTLTAKEGRSSAVGLYVSIFYIGGSVGAFLTGLAWTAAGWSGCVAMIVAMQLIMAAIVARSPGIAIASGR